MWLLLLEAGLALCIFVFIVWWTMRSRPRDEQVQPTAGERSEGPRQSDDGSTPP